MNMLRKRIKDELHVQTDGLLQHLLLYIENNAISNTGSKIDNRAEQAGIRINCGFASSTPWQQPVECELMLVVRKPLKFEAFHQQQTSSAAFNVATQAENHILAGGGDFASFNAGQNQQSYWNVMGEPMLPESSTFPDIIPRRYAVISTFNGTMLTMSVVTVLQLLPTATTGEISKAVATFMSNTLISRASLNQQRASCAAIAAPL